MSKIMYICEKMQMINLCIIWIFFLETKSKVSLGIEPTEYLLVCLL